MSGSNKITQEERDKWLNENKPTDNKQMLLIGANSYMEYLKDPEKFIDNICSSIFKTEKK